MSLSSSKCSVILNKTFIHILKNLSFDNLSESVVLNILKDGRPFSHFIEHWLEKEYPLKHITGCKDYDFVDIKNNEIKYDDAPDSQWTSPVNYMGTRGIFLTFAFE